MISVKTRQDKQENLGMLLKLFREQMGTSVLITASSGDDLAALADRVGFMENGMIARELEAPEYSKWLQEQKKAVW